MWSFLQSFWCIAKTMYFDLLRSNWEQIWSPGSVYEPNETGDLKSPSLVGFTCYRSSRSHMRQKEYLKDYILILRWVETERLEKSVPLSQCSTDLGSPLNFGPKVRLINLVGVRSVCGYIQPCIVVRNGVYLSNFKYQGVIHVVDEVIYKIIFETWLLLARCSSFYKRRIYQWELWNRKSLKWFDVHISIWSCILKHVLISSK